LTPEAEIRPKCIKLTLIGHCTCADWKNSACNKSSRWNCAAGVAEGDVHLIDTDSGEKKGAAHVNTTAVPLSVTSDIKLYHCCNAAPVLARYYC